jgi:hypothetical protein
MISSLYRLAACAMLLAAASADAGVLYLVSEVAAPNGKIGKFDSTTGAAINANFVTGLASPHSLAFSPDASTFYVTNFTTSVRKYAADGTLVSGSYFSGVNQGSGITTDPSSGAVFVVNNGGGGGTQWLNKFNPDGTVINNNFANVATSPDGVLIDGTAALVVRWASSAVGKYVATGTTGTTINATFLTNPGVGTWRPFNVAKDSQGNYYVTGNSRVSKFGPTGTLIAQDFISFTNAYGIAIDENDDIFVGAQNGSVVGKYSSTGSAINASFITGVANITGIVVAPVPEPATYALAALGAAGLGWVVHRRRQAIGRRQG